MGEKVGKTWIKCGWHPLLLGAVSIWGLLGCEPRVNLVTGTTLGLSASPGNPPQSPPSVEFGYSRIEVAVVPTESQVGVGDGTEGGDKAEDKNKDDKKEKPKKRDAFSTLTIFNLSLNWFNTTQIEQFIATGHAARSIIRDVGKKIESDMGKE